MRVSVNMDAVVKNTHTHTSNPFTQTMTDDIGHFHMSVCWAVLMRSVRFHSPWHRCGASGSVQSVWHRRRGWGCGRGSGACCTPPPVPPQRTPGTTRGSKRENIEAVEIQTPNNNKENRNLFLVALYRLAVVTVICTVQSYIKVVDLWLWQCEESKHWAFQYAVTGTTGAAIYVNSKNTCS